MILKLNREEMAELEQYAKGPHGLPNFYSFMAYFYLRMNPDTDEVDLDDEDFERIAEFERGVYKERISKVLRRPMDYAGV